MAGFDFGFSIKFELGEVGIFITIFLPVSLGSSGFSIGLDIG